MSYIARALGAALLAATCPAYAQVTETVLYNFTGGGDGASPNAPLLADTTGPSGALRGLYGTAFLGGAPGCLFGGCGTVFRLEPPSGGETAWGEKTLWHFKGGVDGGNPLGTGLYSPTRRVSDKTPLYGATANGNGNVFSLVGKHLNTLYSFTGGDDGGGPAYGQVVADSTGALYVNSAFGGTSGNGTVIKLTPPQQGQTNWVETTIWTFSGGADGASPNGLIIDSGGALYGSTEGGGSSGNGVVFRLTPPQAGQTAWTETTLWNFAGGSDGNLPLAPLTAGKKGILYGTTISGGSGGHGTAFRLIPPKNGQTNWTEQILWNFTGNADGAEPAAVILDKAGSVYGVTSEGIHNSGTVFRLTPPAQGQNSWTETTLWTFTGGSDGGSPYAALVADSTGALYGTAQSGGSGSACPGNCGVVFSLVGTGFVP